MVGTEHIYASNILWSDHVAFRNNAHIYICMQKLMKTGYEFERVKEMVYGKIWREEREEKNHTIIISKYKINH